MARRPVASPSRAAHCRRAGRRCCRRRLKKVTSHSPSCRGLVSFTTCESSLNISQSVRLRPETHTVSAPSSVWGTDRIEKTSMIAKRTWLEDLYPHSRGNVDSVLESWDKVPLLRAKSRAVRIASCVPSPKTRACRLPIDKNSVWLVHSSTRAAAFRACQRCRRSCASARSNENPSGYQSHATNGDCVFVPLTSRARLLSKR